jgi:acyl carrier protein phosphodiesterase
MNYLAHALLAAPGEDEMFGSLVADFHPRGAIDPALPRGVRHGLALHRAVDVYTDGHPEVRAARALFEPPFRRYAGILLDIWFDHLLARDFDAHAPFELHAFSRTVQRLLQEREAELPPRMDAFARYMRRNDLPEAYRDAATIGRVLQGMAGRVSRANPIADALPELQARARPLQGHFERFFPQLAGFARSELARLAAGDPA